MHIHPLFLLSLGVIGAIVGQYLLGRWFNHLTLYSLIWGTGLAIFEVGWIEYFPLTLETWLMMGYGWFAFAAGSAIPILSRRAIGISSGSPPQVQPNTASDSEIRYLKITVLLLSIFAALGVMQHWMVLIGRFGSIAGVLLNGGIIYSMRTSGQLTGMVPYVDSAALISACLAGIYCGRTGGIRLIGLFPLVIITIDEIGVAARARLLTAGLLFLNAYFVAKIAPATHLRMRHGGKIQRIFATLIVLTVLVFGAESVRGLREGSFRHYGVTSKFEKYPFVSGSLYLYFSAHPGALSAYLKAEDNNPFPTSYTLAPLYRVFVRLGLANPVSPYPKFYDTPISVNTGTYLLDIHAEYGNVGVLVIPYLFGLMCTLIWLEIKKHDGLASIVLLSHVYVLVAAAFALPATAWGFWVLSLVVTFIIAIFIKHFSATAGLARQSGVNLRLESGNV